MDNKAADHRLACDHSMEKTMALNKPPVFLHASVSQWFKAVFRF
jgi:hypothetical protein